MAEMKAVVMAALMVGKTVEQTVVMRDEILAA